MKKPIFQTGAGAETWVAAPLQREPNLPQRILVVDGDPLIRQVNSEVLIYSGYHVDAADDGAAAWDALRVNNYDLLITDNDLPRVTGVELLRRFMPPAWQCRSSWPRGRCPSRNLLDTRGWSPPLCC